LRAQAANLLGVIHLPFGEGLKRLDEIPLPRPEAGFEHHAIGIGVHGFSNHGLGYAHQHNQALAGGGNGMHTLDQSLL
jgi:hypothetical protein